MMLRNLNRFTFRVLSGCCVLAVSAFTVHAQPLTFTTFAGPSGGPGSVDGTGSAGRFKIPQGVATDSAGNVYVADTDNYTIRKITPAGVVTTLAGLAGIRGSADGTGGAARFGSPTSVATDSGGNVYVADRYNDTIRKITPAGVVTTLAGSATSSSDHEDGTGSAARFYAPTGVATDSAGNVYVADEYNNTIRKITPTGVVTTLAGSATSSAGSADGDGSVARFYSPTGVATDNAGNIYVSEWGNKTIRKITQSGVVTTLAGLAGVSGNEDGTGSAARFQFPFGVATDSSGNVYVVDSFIDTVRKITPAGVVTTLAGSTGGSTDGTVITAHFSGPLGIAIDAAGNIYVADTGNDTIRKITPAGVVTTLAGSAHSPSGSADGTGSAARFARPSGVTADSAGNVYVADTFNFTIRKITPAGAVTTFAGSPGFYFGGSADGTGSAAQFNYPGGVATDSAGNVYVADTSNNTIRKITPVRVVTTLAGSAANPPGSADGTGSAARFNSPEGIATDSAGNIYVGDTDNHTIRKITPAGVVTTLAGSPGSHGSNDGTGSAARFDFPSGVATDSAGNVYVADYGNNAIRKVTPTGVVTTLARFSFAVEPNGVATDSVGNVYVIDPMSHTIRKVTPTGEITTLAGSASDSGDADGTGSAVRFDSPQGIATDQTGNIYVADTYNNSIRVGRPSLADIATIDFPTGTAFRTRQLSTFPQTATSWQWTLIRQPSASTATLSSTSTRNPVFIPDVADLYIFQLTASDGVKTSITTVSLTTTPLPKGRAVRHP
jgi:NHL repeat